MPSPAAASAAIPAFLLHARRISHLPSAELHAMLAPETSRGVSGLIDWLMGPARKSRSGAKAVEEVCTRLLALGVPLDRYVSSTSLLHAEHDGEGRIWTRGGGIEETVYVRPAEGDPRYLVSPLKEAKETGEWVELWLPETPDSRFGIVPELKAKGYTHYLCVSMTFMNGIGGWLALASRAPAGFSPRDLAALALIVPAAAALIETRVAWRTLDSVLRTYVGEEPHQAILAGNVKRGMVSTIKSAMLFADMRNSTKLTAGMSGAEAAEVFNAFFDCLVPAIELRHGEVLKYMGDGLLAIFREAEEPPCDAPARALAAAADALETMAAWNAKNPDRPPLHAGIALHYGEAGYGNVGSGQRLDFTVIGRDVSLASRIADLNRPLGEPLLLSAAFAKELAGDTLRLGMFDAKGFAEQVEVHRPGLAAA